MRPGLSDPARPQTDEHEVTSLLDAGEDGTEQPVVGLAVPVVQSAGAQQDQGAARLAVGLELVRQFRRVRAEELVLLGWAVPYFLPTGTFMVKFMRYMLPLLPVFTVMGAAMMQRLGKAAKGRTGIGQRPEEDPRQNHPSLPTGG